jgi:hypothetical protein
MASGSIFPMASILICLLFQAPFAPGSPTDWEIPFKLEGGRIIVRVAIGKTGGLKFRVDTGATCSLVDKTVIRRLGLIAHTQDFRLVNVDRVTTAKKVLLSDVRLGMISASLYCFEADLSEWGVDGVIGLDLLRHQTWLTNSKTPEILRKSKLTIDFAYRTIRFGRSEHFEHSVLM